MLNFLGSFELVQRNPQVTMGLGPVDNTTVPGCPMPYCASRNRSPTSYLHNPEEEHSGADPTQQERANYSSNMDYDMDLIKIVDAKTGEPMGTMNWFAVHATSMKSSSGLISGDNKGYAQYLFEKAINGPSSVRPAGRGPFIAGFGAGAAGDISPNTYGSWTESLAKLLNQCAMTTVGNPATENATRMVLAAGTSSIPQR
eukprot:g11534.t1